MAITAPRYELIPVDGGELSVARWSGDAPVAEHRVVALHGLSGSGMAWALVAEQLERLGSGIDLIAPDLRGRAGSSALPGPYGLDGHLRDVLAVLDHTGAGPVTLVGHSFGAYLSVLAAARHPDRVRGVLLVDGGLPLDVPVQDPDAALWALVGPMIDRLDTLYASPEDYTAYVRAHPALAEHWDPDIGAVYAPDLDPEAEFPARPRTSGEAIRSDGAALLTEVDQLAQALRAVTCPVRHLAAERGMRDTDPGIQPVELVRQWAGANAALRGRRLPDTNHYTAVLSRPGAAEVAAELVDLLGAGTG